jgi:SAM-dependent methyltransferase
VLERARRATADLDTVHLVRGDASRLPLDDATSDVDVVVATFLVGMLNDPGRAVANWCDLVGPGGRVVLANAARTDHWAGPVLNQAFRGIVAVSTPPTTTLRYEDDPAARLDERVKRAHGRLRARSRATIDSRHYLGLVRVTGGIVGDGADDRR